MCGFVGVVSSGAGSSAVGELVAATNRIRHRGPDDEGYMLVSADKKIAEFYSGVETQKGLNLKSVNAFKTNYSLGFGFRRLSIQDLSVKGHQPMTRPWTSSTLMVNGEVYNFYELRELLSKEGYSFNSGSDTEVVLAAYDHWGVDCFSRFDGMWAIAIYDAFRSKLVLARDSFGIKPLYYHFSSKRFQFASEIKALLEFDDVERVANPDSVLNYLNKGRPGINSQSMYEGINQVPSGSYMEFNLRQPEKEIYACNTQFHKIKYINAVQSADSEQGAIEKLSYLLNDSLNKHLRSDVPIAFNVSGGIDSSGLIMCAREKFGADKTLDAYSYVADEEFLSEEKWVDIIADKAGVNFTKVRPNAATLSLDIEELMQIQDEPIGSLSGYAQFLIFKKISQSNIKVSIDGQGADELFGGYLHNLSQFMADLIRGEKFEQARRVLKCSGDLFPGGPEKLVNRTNALLDLSTKKNSYRHPKVPTFASASYFEHHIKQNANYQTESNNTLQGTLFQQTFNSSLPELLRLADRNSMGMSVESRVPYLDPTLYSFAQSLPNELLISNKGETKYLLRKVFEKFLPKEIVNRRDKIGFTVPEKNWLLKLDPWVCDILQNSSSSNNIINKQQVAEHWEAIKHNVIPYNQSIWRAINLAFWAEQSDCKFK